MLVLIILLIGFVSFQVYSRFSALRKLQRTGFPVANSPYSLFGYLPNFLSPQAPWLFGQLRTQYGPTTGVMMGATPALITSDPLFLKEICQRKFGFFHSRMPDSLGANAGKSEGIHMFEAMGSRWKRMRTITSEAISQKNMTKLFPLIDDSSQNFVKILRTRIEDGAIDIHSLFQNHTSDVLARCAFGQLKSCQESNQYYNLFQKAFGKKVQMEGTISTLQWILPCASLWKYVGSMSKIMSKPSMLENFTNHLKNLVEDRIPYEDRPDFMQIFKNAEDKRWNGWYADDYNFVDVSKGKIVRKMTSGEVAAQCRFISIAGFDTTANSLAFIVYLLASNQDVQEKVFREIQSIYQLDINSIQHLPLLNSVICEGLRLFPHAASLQSRHCMEDCSVGTHYISKGISIICDIWSIHRNPEIWGKDADEFRPERFQSNPPWYAWMPFGLGPRQCVGMRFALLEQKVTLYRLLTEFQILPITGELQMSLRDTGTVWPDNLRVQFKERKHQLY